MRTLVTRLDKGHAYILFVLLSMAGGAALRWDALQGSLLGDDWDHYAMHVGIYPVTRGPLDMFNFVGDSVAEREALLRSGRLPWWAAPNLHLAVFRPLSSALIYVDFAWLGAERFPRRAHLHSMLWWFVLMSAVAALLGRLLPLPIAALGVLIYALDDAHALPFTWTANRSEIVSVALVTWGLYAHVCANRARRLRLISLGLVALGLLAGEHALAPLAYFAAYEWLGSKLRWRDRLLALLPLAALTVAYLAIRHILGYGVAGSGFYIDPQTEPLRYLAACAIRLPLLVGDLMFGFAAEWYYWTPPWRAWVLDQHLLPDAWLQIESLRRLQYMLGLLATCLSIGCVFWLGRRSATKLERCCRWLLAGALGSLLPVCGTLPMSRLTVSAAIGFDAALAALLWRSLPIVVARERPFLRTAVGALALALIAVHLFYAPKRGRREVGYYAVRSRLEEDWVLKARVDGQALAGSRVFIINARDWTSQWALPDVLHIHGQVMPASSELLNAASEAPLDLTRVGMNAFDLRLPSTPGISTFNGSVYRPESAAFHPGDTVTMAHFQVHVLATSAGEPTQLRFVFPTSLDDPHAVFLYATGAGLARIALPPVGDRLRLPAPAWPRFRSR